jgi:putative thioredoxin
VNKLLPTEAESRLAALLAAGDEPSLRAVLDLQSDHPGAVVALAELLATSGRGPEALELLPRIPESADTRRVAALARAGTDAVTDDVDAKLDGLLLTVKGDDDARREFLDLLELLGPGDPRTAAYRKRLTTALY